MMTDHSVICDECLFCGSLMTYEYGEQEFFRKPYATCTTRCLKCGAGMLYANEKEKKRGEETADVRHHA